MTTGLLDTFLRVVERENYPKPGSKRDGRGTFPGAYTRLVHDQRWAGALCR